MSSPAAQDDSLQDEIRVPRSTAIATSTTGLQPVSSIFTTPEPIKRLFSNFPLQLLPANSLPHRTHTTRHTSTLFVFTDPETLARTPLSESKKIPSFNPTCLKWQTYLLFRNLDFVLASSSNHASPSGALPFLQPGGAFEKADEWPSLPVPAEKLSRWCSERKMVRPSLGHNADREEAYLALIEEKIRPAWLYALYVSPSNFKHIAQKLYVDNTTSSLPTHSVLSKQLQTAALSELTRNLPAKAPIEAESLYASAQQAFEALATLLNDSVEGQWAFNATEPGLLDASIFAYTHLLLDESMDWQESTLQRIVQNNRRLVRHRRKVWKKYFA